MNRFNNTYENQYVSTHVDLPFQELLAAGAMKQDQHDKAESLLEAAKEPITGGNVTKGQAAALNAKIQSDLEAMHKNAENSGNFNQLSYQVKDYANKLKANPIYQGIELDKQLSPQADKSISEDGSDQYIQNYFDHNKGEYNQLPNNVPFNASIYKDIKPGDTFSEHKSIYDAVKPVIDKIYSDPVTNTWIDDMGQEHTQVMQEGLETESKRRDQVRQAIAPYILGDRNAMNKQSLIYNKALHEQQNPGSKYDPNDALDDVANAFVGEYSTEKEIQKLGTDKVTKMSTPRNAGSGSGSGSNSNVDNKILNIIKESTTNGGSVLDAGDQAAMLNGTADSKNGTVTFNAQDRTIYLSTAATGNQADVEKAVTINKAIPLKVKEADIFNSLEDDKSVAVNYNNKEYTILKSNNSVIPGKEYMLTPKGESVATRLVSLKEAKDIIKKGNSDYLGIKKEANSLGIDLEDPKLDNDIKNNVGDTDALSTLNTALSNINGEITMLPGSGKNFFTDNDGDPLVKGDAFVTIAQMKQIAPDNAWFSSEGFNKLEKLGLIKPHTMMKVDDTGKEVETEGYVMKVITPVTGSDIETTTRKVDVNQWGNSEWVAKNVPGHVAEAKNELFKIKTNKQISKFTAAYDKNPNQTITDLDYEINQYGKDSSISSDDISQLNEHKVSILEDKKLSNKDKAKELFKIKMALSDPNGYQLIFGGQDQQSDNTGKPQEEWKQTKATPLK